MQTCMSNLTTFRDDIDFYLNFVKLTYKYMGALRGVFMLGTLGGNRLTR